MKTKNGLIGALFLSLCLLGIPESLSAQESGASAAIGKFRVGMLELEKEMLSLTQSLKTVADVERAEPKIVAMMEQFLAMVVSIGEDFEAMTPEEVAGVQSFETLMQDPELEEWGLKLEEATDTLKENHPDVAAKLQEITEKNRMKFMSAVMDLAVKIQQKIGAGMEEGEFYQEGEGEGY